MKKYQKMYLFKV